MVYVLLLQELMMQVWLPGVVDVGVYGVEGVGAGSGVVSTETHLPLQQHDLLSEQGEQVATPRVVILLYAPSKSR